MKNKYRLNNADIYAKETRRHVLLEVITFAICAGILAGGISIARSTIKNRTSDGFDVKTGDRRSHEVRNATKVVSPSPCRQENNEIVVCSSKVYIHVHWKYATQTITATVTAYDAQEFPGQNAVGLAGIVGNSIACPRSIRLGSRVHVRSVGWLTCDDRTARKFDGRFDLFVRTRAEALAWGKRSEEVIITYDHRK